MTTYSSHLTEEEILRFLRAGPCQALAELTGLSDAELFQACISEMSERSSQTFSN